MVSKRAIDITKRTNMVDNLSAPNYTHNVNVFQTTIIIFSYQLFQGYDIVRRFERLAWL